MAKTFSTMLPIGTKAIPFNLKNANSNIPNCPKGNWVAFDDIRGAKGTLIMFICNHCPYVVHVREQMKLIAKYCFDHNIGCVGINANDPVAYPADGFDEMEKQAREHRYIFPYLFDDSQDVAKAYQAACTPEFYLFDKGDRLVYRGRMDGSTPGNQVINDGNELRHAIEALINNAPISEEEQKPSMGCNIKWRQGNAPSYFQV